MIVECKLFTDVEMFSKKLWEKVEKAANKGKTKKEAELLNIVMVIEGLYKKVQELEKENGDLLLQIQRLQELNNELNNNKTVESIHKYENDSFEEETNVPACFGTYYKCVVSTTNCNCTSEVECKEASEGYAE